MPSSTALTSIVNVGFFSARVKVGVQRNGVSGSIQSSFKEGDEPLKHTAADAEGWRLS